MIELPMPFPGVKSRSGILKNQLDLTVIIFSQCGIGKVQRLAIEADRTAVGRRQSISRRARVLLPQPLVPASHRHSPGATLKLTLQTAGSALCSLKKVLLRLTAL